MARATRDPALRIRQKLTRQSGEPMQIILAWTADDFEIVRERRTDLGERPELRKITVPKTVVWLNRGGHEDVAKAEKYAKSEGYHVFVYPQSVKDARAQAAKDILAASGKQEKQR